MGIYDIRTESTVQLIDKIDYVRSVAYSPDGSLLAAGGHDNKAVICDVSITRDLIHAMYTSDRVISLAFSTDGTNIAVGGEDTRKMVMYDVRTGDTIQTNEREEFVISISYSPDGSQIIVVGCLMMRL